SLRIKLLLAENNIKEAETAALSNISPDNFFLITAVVKYYISRENYKAAMALINKSAKKITSFPEKLECEVLMAKIEYLDGASDRAGERLKHILLWPMTVNFARLFYDINHSFLSEVVNTIINEGNNNPFY